MLYWDAFQILCLPHVNKCDFFSLSNSATAEMLQHLDSRWIQHQFSLTCIFSKHGPVYCWFCRVYSWTGNHFHSEYFPTMKMFMMCFLLHSCWSCYTVCCVLLQRILKCALHLRWQNLSICLRFKSVSIWPFGLPYVPHVNNCCLCVIQVLLILNFLSVATYSEII